LVAEDLEISLIKPRLIISKYCSPHPDDITPAQILCLLSI
jgi:hypothetical protein